MFEVFRPPDLSSRLRVLSAVPLAAFLVVEAYFTIAQLLPRTPPGLFWTIDGVALTGALAGFTGALRLAVIYRRELRGWAIGWLVVAILVSALPLWRFIGLTFPWL